MLDKRISQQVKQVVKLHCIKYITPFEFLENQSATKENMPGSDIPLTPPPPPPEITTDEKQVDSFLHGSTSDKAGTENAGQSVPPPPPPPPS